jgi:tetratricopeptide (TPR) repeat protein
MQFWPRKHQANTYQINTGMDMGRRRGESWRRLAPLVKTLITTILCLLCFVGWAFPVLAQASQPELSPPIVQEISDLRQKAFTASQTGQFAEAETYWSQLIEYLPTEAALWSNRGNVRVSQNKLEVALEDYNQAVTLAPDQPDPYLNRGAALEGLGRWKEAIADYSQVLALNPEDAAAYNNRGNAQAGLGHWDAALADYQTAAELDPKFAFARVNAALAEYQLGQPDEAIRQFRSLTRRYPNFADARAALTAALWGQGQRGEAESNWVAVVGLDGRYKDLDWVRTVRRWPPAMVAALEKFLNL